MRILMIFCLLIGSGKLWSQVYTFDSTLPLNISGTRDYFQLSNGEVQLQAPTTTSRAHLDFPINTNPATSYEVVCHYDVEPSATNVMSMRLGTSTQNTFVNIRLGGESGSNDKIEVFYSTNGTSQSLWKSAQGIGSLLPISLRILCITYDHQHFNLAISFASGVLIDSGEFHLPSSLSVSSVTWDILYTSTRTNKYRLQTLRVIPLFTCINPVVNENGLDVLFKFSQTIHLISEPAWPSALPTSTYQLTDSTLQLFFDQKPTSGDYIIDLSFLRNTQDDTLFSSQITIRIEPTIYPGILRITEVMSDPEPSVGLPNTEYIELYHAGTEELTIHLWQIFDNSGVHLLPDFSIVPEEVIVIAPIGKCSLFTTRCLEWNDFPNLNNDNDFLSLYSSKQTLVDSVYYTTITSDYRSGGGYPWIRKNIPVACSQSPTLSYPENLSDATPGETIYSSIEPDFIKSATLINDSTLHVQFNYYVQLNAPFNTSDFHYDFLLPLQEKINVGEAKSVPMSLHTSCRTTDIHSLIVPIIHPKTPSLGNLFITEVLADAEAYASEFIEITNTSSDYITTRSTRIKLTTGSSVKEIILPSMTLSPGEIVAFCADTTALLRTHPHHGNLAEVSNWQSVDDRNCTVVLLFQSTTLDSIVISSSLHSVFQNNTEGWSLEKINISEPTFQPSNWITAPEKGSPGLANHFHFTSAKKEAVYCDPCHLQSNQPMDNHIVIHLPTIENGSRVSISINSLSGLPIHYLASNEAAYSGQTFLWRGEGLETGSPLAAWYIAHVQVWQDNGDKKLFRVLISSASF